MVNFNANSTEPGAEATTCTFMGCPAGWDYYDTHDIWEIYNPKMTHNISMYVCI